MSLTFMITGSTGFVGSGLVKSLSCNSEYKLRLAMRSNASYPLESEQCKTYEIGTIDSTTNWEPLLQGVDVVVHLAARVHVLRERAENPLHAFREINVLGTEKLAQAAARCGVKRFVFVSSIGVNGALSQVGKPFNELSEPQPHNAYALSKWEAEQKVRDIAAKTGMEFVVIRPPLVYGKGAPGNFAVLKKAVALGLPLPLKSVQNLRSLVGLDNLVNFIELCCHHPRAANHTFLVSDGSDLSTSDLIRRIALASDRKVRLFSVPVLVLLTAATFFCQRARWQGLCGNLQIDITKARTLLNWSPPVPLDEGVRRAVTHKTAA